MATRTITTTITLDQEAQFKKEMEAVNGELRNLKSEMQLVEETFRDQAESVDALEAKNRVLRKSVEQQEEKVRALQRAMEDGKEAYGEGSAQLDKYQQALNRAQAELIRMNRELDSNQEQLDQARKSSDDYADSLDDLADKMKDTDGGIEDLAGDTGLGDLIKQFKNLKGVVVGTAIVGGIKAIGDAIIGVVESTQEYRQVMGTLQQAGQEAGYSVEETTAVYNRLYSVIGDTGAAAEATTQLQSLGLTQDRLNELTDATIGAWVTMGQSAPIESISEAVQQTISAGTATGAFADLLVMAGVSEDEFNEKLADCQTEAGRFNVVLQELARQGLAETGQGWIDNNQDIVTMNESTAKMDAAMGELGETLAPIAAGLINLGAEAITKVVVPALNTAIEKTKEFNDQMRNMREEMREAGGSMTGQGFNFDFVHNPDGSHADGLAYVPFDGYVAELHKGERILTAAENRMLAAMGADLRPTQGGITAGQMQQIMATSVNAIAAGQQVQAIPAQITLKMGDGSAMATWLLPDLRTAMKSDPEVVNDA